MTQESPRAFWDKTPKAQKIRTNIHEWNSVKLKTFSAKIKHYYSEEKTYQMREYT